MCLATSLFNAVVDPFGVTPWVTSPSLNAYRPAAATRVRLVKAWDVRRIQPRAIALGTSRTHLGLRMTHPGWPGEARYNLAFDGATTEEMYAYLKHAQAVTPLRAVVLGLDTWHLQGNPTAVRPDFDPAILLEPGSASSRWRAELSLARILLNFDTAMSSIRTLQAQGNPQPNWFGKDGQRLGEVFFRRRGEEFTDIGPAAYFWRIDRQEIGYKLPALPEQTSAPVRDTGPPPVSSFTFIERIIEFCRDNDIALMIYITPAHAHQSEISQMMGEAPAIERGKRRLVKVLSEDAAAHPADAYPLWDFSGYSSVTTDPLPTSPHQEMADYWDSSHFKAEVGDWVLDRLFGVSRPGHEVPADFGRRLTPQNIEVELQTIRDGQKAYAASHAADIVKLERFLEEARAEQVSNLR